MIFSRAAPSETRPRLKNRAMVGAAVCQAIYGAQNTGAVRYPVLMGESGYAAQAGFRPLFAKSLTPVQRGRALRYNNMNFNRLRKSIDGSRQLKVSGRCAIRLYSVYWPSFRI